MVPAISFAGIMRLKECRMLHLMSEFPTKLEAYMVIIPEAWNQQMEKTVEKSL